jgi:hypothetical protein
MINSGTCHFSSLKGCMFRVDVSVYPAKSTYMCACLELSFDGGLGSLLQGLATWLTTMRTHKTFRVRFAYIPAVLNLKPTTRRPVAEEQIF